MVIGNFERRSGRRALTGEWIVFRKVEGRNRYVTLARHDEEDAAVAERVERYERDDDFRPRQSE